MPRKADDVVLNGEYLGRHDGTASWTECVLDAFEFGRVVRPGFDPTRVGRATFYWKVAYEVTFRWRGGAARVHPCSAPALDRNASIVLLDAIGSGGTGTGWHPRLVRRSIQLARRVATISRAESRILEEIHGRKFSVLTPYPARAFFADIAQPLPASGPFRIGYWGGWHPRKAVEAFMQQIEPSTDLQFVCTGTPPPSLAGRPDITWLGRLSRDEQIQMIDSVHGSIYPSTREGFGLPPFESLLRDRPVIIQPLDCYRDFVDVDHESVVVMQDGHAAQESIDRLMAVAFRANHRSALYTPTLALARERLAGQFTAWLADQVHTYDADQDTTSSPSRAA